MDNVYKKETPIMSQKRKRHSTEFKAKVALEARMVQIFERAV